MFSGSHLVGLTFRIDCPSTKDKMKVIFIYVISICQSISSINCAMNMDFALKMPPVSLQLPRYQLPPMKMSIVMNHDPDSDQLEVQVPRMLLTNKPGNSIIINENSSTDYGGSNRPYHGSAVSPSDPMVYRRRLYRMRGSKYDKKYHDKVAKIISIPYLMVPPRFSPKNKSNSTQKGGSLVDKPIVQCPNCYHNSQQIAHHHHHVFHGKIPKHPIGAQRAIHRPQFNAHLSNGAFHLTRSPIRVRPLPPISMVKIYHN